jgi:multidrug efflux pump subunit AcrA (membrane-fusion protein)
MAALTLAPAALDFVLDTFGSAYTPLDVRGVAPNVQTATKQLTARGPFADTAALAKVGGAAWLTIPADCTNATAFDVSVDASALAVGTYTETVRASKVGWDDADCLVTLIVRPEGFVRAR